MRIVVVRLKIGRPKSRSYHSRPALPAEVPHDVLAEGGARLTEGHHRLAELAGLSHGTHRWSIHPSSVKPGEDASDPHSDH